MAILEAKRICDLLKGLMLSKVSIEICESRSNRSCAQRLELELSNFSNFEAEAASMMDRLLILYQADPERLRPLLMKHALQVVKCMNALDNFYGTHFRKTRRHGLCENSFLRLHIEKLEFFREHKELLCLFIFDFDWLQQFISTLSPRTALSRLMPEVKVLVVGVEDRPEEKKDSVKTRFRLLLDSGFFDFQEIKFAPKMDQLNLAAAIVGCSIRYLQILEEEMRTQGQDPFPKDKGKDPGDELFEHLPKN